MGNRLIAVLVAQYLVIAVVAAVDRNWPRVLYFICAAGISVAVLWMSES